METLDVTVKNIIYEAPDTGFKVLKVINTDNGKRFTAVGELPELSPDQKLTISGEWTHHDRFGRQFQIDRAEIHEPTTEEGIQNYLSSSLIKGIGPKLAEKITDKFGDDTLNVMDSEIERLKNISGIGSSKLEQIKEDWNEQRHTREVMLFLKEHGISTAYAQKIYQEYEDDAVYVLQTNPYKLCRDVDGIGFTIADRIARKLGIEEQDDARLEAGLVHVLDDAAEDGHVFIPEAELKEKARQILDMDVDSVDVPLRNLENQNRVVRENGDTPVVYSKPLYDAENRVAEKLISLQNVDADTAPEAPSTSELNEFLSEFNENRELDYNSKQRRAIRTVLRERVMVLTGGPGTGKTTTMTGMLEAMDAFEWDVKLAAPTGRAAQRMENATGHQASTIHRLLDYKPPNTFEKNENDPLETDALILDELSMVDLWLMDRLLRAIDEGTRLILIGDADQLASVGPGDILNDLIESGEIPVVRLTEIFRQARESRIVQNAHRINNGEMPELENQGDGDFFYIERDDPGRARDTIVDLVADRIPNYYDSDPFDDVQVIAPMYRGKCGVDTLNEYLQRKINPGSDADSLGSENFRNGDRVMQLTNNYEKYVFNGDIGRVSFINSDDEKMQVRFPGAGAIEYSKSDLAQLTLAYAITIHKSQGSEFPVVIIPLLTQHYIMLQRNLLYTALTRAQNLAVLVGSKRALGMAVNNAKDQARYTKLPDRIRTISRKTTKNN